MKREDSFKNMMQTADLMPKKHTQVQENQPIHRLSGIQGQQVKALGISRSLSLEAIAATSA